MDGCQKRFGENSSLRCPARTRVKTKVPARRRWQFHHVILCVQILVSIASLSLPAALGLAGGMTPRKGMNNLSPVENILLGSRLEEIKSGIEKEYCSSCSNTDIKTFIFPGAGGVDELVLELQESKPNSVVVDWKNYRGSLLTAGFDSEAVGEAIAGMVLQNNMKSSEGVPKSIQFIGISVGAFAANAAATIVHRELEEKKRNDSDDTCDVHFVLLDPFCGRGVFGPNYGRDNFGKHATTALQILNTDDPVPTTNDSLPLCYCLDVTDAPERRDFVPLPGDSMHSWPLAYFARHYVNEDGTILSRGTVKIVS